MKQERIAEKLERKSTSFVVRVFGHIANDNTLWRGQVEHIQSGEKRLFKGVDDLILQMKNLSS